MLDDLEYVHEDGTNNIGNLTVYALSTCGFCKKALAFLKENNIKFRYIYVDLLDNDTKSRIKEELRQSFDERIGFPFCVIDEKECLVGFTESKWQKKFLEK